MITLEQLAAIDEQYKEFKKQVKAYHRKSEKVSMMDPVNTTQRRRDNACADLNWAAMELDKQQFKFHTEIVRARICDPFDDAMYGVKEYRPSGWHTYTVQQPHPIKG